MTPGGQKPGRLEGFRVSGTGLYFSSIVSLLFTIFDSYMHSKSPVSRRAMETLRWGQGGEKDREREREGRRRERGHSILCGCVHRPKHVPESTLYMSIRV